MSYSIGIDGGGTKTDCVVLDADGTVVGEGRGGPSNPMRSGFEAAFTSISEAAAEALKTAHLHTGDVTGVCAGLAGAGRRNVVRRTMVFLAHEFPRALAQVNTDYEIALETAAGSGPGIVLIAGTGSVAYGRNADGETARAGGYGPWIGDEGSAFDIGRRAVAAVARTRDHDAPVTLLADMIPSVLGCSDWDDLMQRIMKNPDDVFPKLFPAVADAANSDDSAAKEILFTAAIGLGNLSMVVTRRLGLKDKEFPLVKYGGVFGRSSMLDALLDSVLASGALQAKISRLQISPAVGAARIALDNSYLTESQLLKTLAMQSLPARIVAAIASHEKWSKLVNVRVALLRHVHAPAKCAAEFAPDLPLRDIEDLLALSRLPASVRGHLCRELARRGVS